MRQVFGLALLKIFTSYAVAQVPIYQFKVLPPAPSGYAFVAGSGAVSVNNQGRMASQAELTLTGPLERGGTWGFTRAGKDLIPTWHPLPLTSSYIGSIVRGVRDTPEFSRAMTVVGKLNPIQSAYGKGGLWTGEAGQSVLTEINPPERGGLELVAINAAGTVAGNGSISDGGPLIAAVVAPSGSTTTSALDPSPGLTPARAEMITAEGKIYGYVTTPDGLKCAVKWDSSSGVATPLCPPDWLESSALDANDNGVIVGSANFGGNVRGVFRIKPGDFMRKFDGYSSIRVNSTGNACIYGGNDGWVWLQAEATPRSLTSLLGNPLDAAPYQISATDISDNGQVVGVTSQSGVVRTMVATPVRATPIPVTVNASLLDRVAAGWADKTLRYDVVVGMHVLASGYAAFSSNGSVTVPVSATGKFSLRLRPAFGGSNTFDSWLDRVVHADATAGAQTLHVSFRNGDIDGDNQVSILDYLALSANLEKTSTSSGWMTPVNGISPQMCDVDEDEEVSILDYLILSAAYEIKGDEL